MAITTFSPPVHPDFGMGRKYKPKVLMAQFGDGYAQRAADGTNNNPVALSATWTNLTRAERDYIVNFFDTCNGVASFRYAYVDEPQPKVYICPEWDDVLNDAGGYTVTASLQQVYDLG